MQTIILNGGAIGCVIKFEIDGDAELTYALSKEHWGKGITTEALAQFLKLETARPLHGRVAYDNMGSQRVLKRNGFVRIATEKGFANARGMEIEEFVYRLGE